jgi:hypothetical protein
MTTIGHPIGTMPASESVTVAKGRRTALRLCCHAARGGHAHCHLGAGQRSCCSMAAISGSQFSAASQADPANTALTAQVATAFKGETLRGLLLYAWGWSVVSTIALYAAIGALIRFIGMAFVTIGDFVADPRIAAHQIRQS